MPGTCCWTHSQTQPTQFWPTGASNTPLVSNTLYQPPPTDIVTRKESPRAENDYPNLIMVSMVGQTNISYGLTVTCPYQTTALFFVHTDFSAVNNGWWIIRIFNRRYVITDHEVQYRTQMLMNENSFCAQTNRRLFESYDEFPNCHHHVCWSRWKMNRSSFVQAWKTLDFQVSSS